MSGDPFGLTLDRICAILGDGTAFALTADDHRQIARAQLKTALQAIDQHGTAAALAFAEDAVLHLRKALGVPTPKIDDLRDPDQSREGIFRNHNCWKCKDGRDLSRCPTPDRPGNCGYPHARND